MKVEIPYFSTRTPDPAEMVDILLNDYKGKYPYKRLVLGGPSVVYIFYIPDEDLLLLRMKHPEFDNIGRYVCN